MEKVFNCPSKIVNNSKQLQQTRRSLTGLAWSIQTFKGLVGRGPIHVFFLVAPFIYMNIYSTVS